MSLSTFISINLQSADWRINGNRTDVTKAIVTAKMIHDIAHDDADRARGILATLYHNDRPQLRRLCADYCQEYSRDYGTLYAKWEQWVLTGSVALKAEEPECCSPLCGNCGLDHSIQQCPEIATAMASSTLTFPVGPAPFTTSIEYDRTSHRFIGRVNGNVCGEYETYLDADQDITAFADEMSLSIAVGDVTPTAEDERISRLVHALAELQETAEQAEDYAAVRAFARAAYQVGKGIVVIGTGESWIVPSGTRPNTTHTVSQSGGVIICSCEAGINGAQCWHAALIEGQIKAGQ